ncbi:MAG: hypothetical protein JXR87_05065, partial [Candidatus Marinimicrobia bacterium]|nr:hypothetical protein [Candidatus Neomarinimicrobiota bacterium]
YFFYLLIILWFQLLPWGSSTHKTLVDQSVFKSIPFGLEDETWLKMFNMDKGFFYKYFSLNSEQYDFMQMIDKGIESEDSWVSPFSMRRSDNHFHNPLLAFASAGLNDIASGQSMAVWAQDGTSQDPYPEKDQSWQKVREFYFSALIADNNNDKMTNLGKVFKGIGHQIHFIQDAAVPDHARNDTHLLNGDPFGFVNKLAGSFRCIEGWADWNTNLLYSFSDNPIFPSTHFNHILYTTAIPISNLIDSNSYDGTNPTTSMEQGLAEYANANFVSEDTICTDYLDPDHKHYFPYPKFSSTDLDIVANGEKAPELITAYDDKQDYVRYIKKIQHGETMNHFLKLGYFSTAAPLVLKKTLFIDDLCHKDYASMLIPRAVGYSAALINYFFRGEIEISLPVSDPGSNPPQKEGIYSLCADPAAGFDKISLMVRNITADNEEMTDGLVSLVLSYRTCIGDPFSPDHLALEEERKFISVNHPDEVSIPRDVPIRINFDLSETPLPYNAMDVTLTIVFKGNLGAELNNAVAVGFKDIGEPTPVDLFNNTDLVCFHGSYVPYTDPALLQEVDINQNGEIDCDLYEITIIPSEITPQYLSFNGVNADEGNHYFQYPENTPAIQPGESLRFYYLTDDYPATSHFSIHVDSKFISNPAIPINGSCQPFHTDDVNDGYAYVNRLHWESAEVGYLQTKSLIYNYRGLDYFHVIRYENITVPLGTSCTQGSSASIQNDATLTDEERSQNHLQPRITDINQRLGNNRK